MTMIQNPGPIDAEMPGPTLNERVAVNLIRARLALQLRPVDICRRTGIAANAYGQWEKTARIPRLDQAFLLCENLDYTMDWIYREDPSGLPKRIADNLPAKDDPRIAKAMEPKRKPGKATKAKAAPRKRAS